jgi:hypothetical protein
MLVQYSFIDINMQTLFFWRLAAVKQLTIRSLTFCAVLELLHVELIHYLNQLHRSYQVFLYIEKYISKFAALYPDMATWGKLLSGSLSTE